MPQISKNMKLTNQIKHAKFQQDNPIIIDPYNTETCSTHFVLPTVYNTIVP